MAYSSSIAIFNHFIGPNMQTMLAQACLAPSKDPYLFNPLQKLNTSEQGGRCSLLRLLSKEPENTAPSRPDGVVARAEQKK
jgi:hypothetical protein